VNPVRLGDRWATGIDDVAEAKAGEPAVEGQPQIGASCSCCTFRRASDLRPLGTRLDSWGGPMDLSRSRDGRAATDCLQPDSRVQLLRGAEGPYLDIAGKRKTDSDLSHATIDNANSLPE